MPRLHRRCTRLAIWLAIAGSLGAVDASADRPSFFGLGSGSPDPQHASYASAISADGRWIVGRARGSAVRWGPDGVLFLPAIGFAPVTWSNVVSDDGAVVAGVAYVTDSDEDHFVWRNGSSMQLQHPTATVASVGGTSADGAVLVGRIFETGTYTAYRLEDGEYELLYDSRDPGAETSAEDVSADASIVVGSTRAGGSDQAARWQGGVTTAIGPPPDGYRSSIATGISPDGTAIVGRFAGYDTSQSFLWTDAGVTLLGHLPGDGWSEALAVSNGGSRVVGWSGVTQSHPVTPEAIVWEPASGMRPLREVLLDDYGVDVGGWILEQAADVAADGVTVVGRGRNPEGGIEAWAARLVVPECRNGIDDDGDGAIDHGADAGCASRVDASEREDCADGFDDDGDGAIDFPEDPGCGSSADPDERAADVPCDDGADDDGDGLADFPADPSCASPAGTTEAAACDDAVDADGDGAVGFYSDTGCSGPWDTDERLEPLAVVDLFVSGDGLVTRDPNDGLDWLDLTATAGLSPEQVRAGVGGWSEQGWRHASLEEVCLLFDRVAYGEVTDGGRCAGSYRAGCEDCDAFEELFALFGITQADSVMRASLGFYGSDPRDMRMASWVRFDAFGFVDASLHSAGSVGPEVGHLLVRESPPACSNDVDDDGDGASDHPDDSGCRDAWDASEAQDCANGLDDDGDGRIDLADPGCAFAEAPDESPPCDDRLDQDGDGLVDLDDPQCGTPASHWESRGCGLGAELLIGIWLAALRRRLTRSPRGR